MSNNFQLLLTSTCIKIGWKGITKKFSRYLPQAYTIFFPIREREREREKHSRFEILTNVISTSSVSYYVKKDSIRKKNNTTNYIHNS